MAGKTDTPHQPFDRLLKRPDFIAARSGQSASGAFVRLQVCQRPEAGAATPRVGFTVTKKVGGAVERNRIKRRLREAVKREAASYLRPRHDYVFIARRDALTAPFGSLCDDLSKTVGKAHSKLKTPANATT